MVPNTALLSSSDVVHLIFEETGEHVSAEGVRRWQRLGLLTAERTVGGRFVFRAGDVRKFLDRRRERRELRGRRGAGELEPPGAA